MLPDISVACLTVNILIYQTVSTAVTKHVTRIYLLHDVSKECVSFFVLSSAIVF
jgi:hypothetical protein